jgi:hypothetical protein
MHKINERGVPEEVRESPKGTFHLHRRHLSLALGGVKDIGT